MKKKIAFVVPRYGLKINGGAETLCREYAESLVDDFEVTVLSTVAEDYTTWSEKFSEGKELVNGVTVLRFKTVPRASDFDAFTQRVVNDKDNAALAEEWMRKQGPYSPDLISYIRDNAKEYDHFLFVPYLYATTHFGIKEVRKKSILIPAAHDEPTIYFGIFDETFREAGKIIFLTEQEREFSFRRFKSLPKNEVIGMGVDLLESNPEGISEFKLERPYAIYAGRIDPSKGCGELISYYDASGVKEQIDLVFIGKKAMDIPESVKYLGFVSDAQKHALIEAAEFCFLPSRYESFSISLLEYFSHKKAVIVNGASEVLKSHCINANAGLWYENQQEWDAAVEYFLNNRSMVGSMGKNGYEYVKNNYQKDRIVQKLKQFLA